MKNQYVILTGSKNNAGDYLIKHRAKILFEWLRPDRDIIDVDGWKPFSDEVLKTVNESRAVILMGGPALQKEMRPLVYGLRNDLDEITAPIITMGIGWFSHKGRWADTHSYPLNEASMQLLNRIASSGHFSSVRDYHTLNVLATLGFKNFTMTGCPALYSREHLGTQIQINEDIKKIGFSLGVSLKSSKKMEAQMKEAILIVRDSFPNTNLEVVFHHATVDNDLNRQGSARKLHQAQRLLIEWLVANGINYVDISGSAENLVNYYQSCDLHIGYRVHAHIFMCSISKASVLLNEDGRGIALRGVLGGGTFDAYKNVREGKYIKILHKLGIPFDNYIPAENLPQDLVSALKYEYLGGVRYYQPRNNIDLHFVKMKDFIRQLP